MSIRSSPNPVRAALMSCGAWQTFPLCCGSKSTPWQDRPELKRELAPQSARRCMAHAMNQTGLVTLLAETGNKREHEDEKQIQACGSCGPGIVHRDRQR